jgi:hypothetical protein
MKKLYPEKQKAPQNPRGALRGVKTEPGATISRLSGVRLAIPDGAAASAQPAKATVMGASVCWARADRLAKNESLGTIQQGRIVFDRKLIRLEGTVSPRTFFLSRLIGLYCILVALSMITRKQATLESVTALLHNPSMTLIVGVITLGAGLAMVLAHNIWSGGALPVVVTLVGWVTLLKSLFLLFLPPEVEAGFFLRQLHYPDLFYVYSGISLVLGIYLTYGGFRSTSR